MLSQSYLTQTVSGTPINIVGSLTSRQGGKTLLLSVQVYPGSSKRYSCTISPQDVIKPEAKTLEDKEFLDKIDFFVQKVATPSTQYVPSNKLGTLQNLFGDK